LIAPSPFSGALSKPLVVSRPVRIVFSKPYSIGGVKAGLLPQISWPDHGTGIKLRKAVEDPLVMKIRSVEQPEVRDVTDVKAHLGIMMMKWRSLACVWLAICGLATVFCTGVAAQAAPPFEVSNPKHLNWSVEEAGKIYTSACALVARSVRPEKPPQLEPKFLLVLGAKADQVVRGAGNSEIQLRKWDPGRFAEAMVVLTLRETVKNEEIMQLARDTLNAAEATVSVNELRKRR
jgi:hypothetical protein